MKELKVGERVTITLEAVERKGGCKGCFFSTSGECFKRADFDFACLKRIIVILGFYVILTIAVLYIAFMGGVIGYLIGKYWKKD